MTPDLSHLHDDVVRNRVLVLGNLDVKANDLSRLAGIKGGALKDYMRKLKDLGLVDSGERLTETGAAYLHIAQQKSPETPLDKRTLWNRIGGDEERLDRITGLLIDRGLVAHDDDSRTYTVLQEPLSVVAS